MVSYILVLRLDTSVDIKVGKLGKIHFKSGYYLYVGSAKKSLKRVERHFKSKKKMRWHIDYLSEKSKVLSAIILKEEECRVASKLSERFEMIKNFGCSDCKCDSHLFYSSKKPYKTIKKLFGHLEFYS